MGVNNARVHTYIQDALDNNWSGLLIPRLDAAFTEVNAQRGLRCTDINLAAADHYLIMRYLTNRFSPAIAGVLVTMVAAYDGLYKGVRDLVTTFGGPDIVFRTGNCKATPFSPLVIAWGDTGITDGTLDCVPGGPHWQSSPDIYAPKIPAGLLHRLFR
jgi:hypothetical protein